MGSGKLFPLFKNFAFVKRFAPFMDGNNNPTVKTKISESCNETGFVNFKKSTKNVINKSPFKFGDL